MKNNKLTIKETIVVEGKTDLIKLKSIFNVNVIIVNGFAITQEKINYIKEVNKNIGVILFFDPDYVGEMIRKKIINQIPNIKNCYITKKDIIPNSKKIGVAEAKKTAIIEAIKNVVTFNTFEKESLTLKEYNQLKIDCKEKRLKICNALKIAYANNKQLLKQLNLMGITKNKIIELL